MCCSWLFLSSEQIQHATQTLTDFRSGALVPGQLKDAELWKLRQATFVSCSTAVGLGKIVEKARGLSPGTRSFLGKCVLAVNVACKDCNVLVAITHSFALVPTVLLLPPYLYEVMKKTKVMPKGKYPRLAAELGTFPGFRQKILVAVALFPQIGTISADDVEEEFRSRVDRHGQPIRQFTYNKGI
ncbi:hypothetical protein BBJ28_00003734 [Nothophytophthora sp. Chile5]|nr:hypothetical protein BBJ28_00003734 [Nothophytophthora sp. Chile5]